MAEENKQQFKIDNDELVATIKELKENRSDENFAKVSRLIQTANFVCPVEVAENTEAVEKEDGKVALENKRSFKFHVLRNSDGKKYMAVFTSPEEISKANNKDILPPNNYIVLNIVALMGAFKNGDTELSGMVIDPFSNNFAVPGNIIARLADSEVYTPKPNEQVKVTVPTRYPDGFIETMREKLDENDKVNQLFLFILERQNQAKSLLFIVDDDLGIDDRRELYGTISQIASPFVQGMHLMFVPYTDNFARTVSENKLPCYRK